MVDQVIIDNLLDQVLELRQDNIALKDQVSSILRHAGQCLDLATEFNTNLTVVLTMLKLALVEHPDCQPLTELAGRVMESIQRAD